jgi:elongation factor P
VPVITTNDLKNGYVLDIDGDLVSVVSFQHVKPGKGGAFVRTKLKNMVTGAVVDRTFRAGEKVERVTTETREMQFLYRDGDELHLMDNATYEQMAVPASSVENDDLLAPNTDVTVLFIRERPIRIDLPTFVELAVARTDPGVKGDTVSNVMKPAELETGATIDVPLFVNEGDRLKIDTRTREYSARA